MYIYNSSIVPVWEEAPAPWASRYLYDSAFLRCLSRYALLAPTIVRTGPLRDFKAIDVLAHVVNTQEYAGLDVDRFIRGREHDIVVRQGPPLRAPSSLFRIPLLFSMPCHSDRGREGGGGGGG